MIELPRPVYYLLAVLFAFLVLSSLWHHDWSGLLVLVISFYFGRIAREL